MDSGTNSDCNRKLFLKATLNAGAVVVSFSTGLQTCPQATLSIKRESIVIWLLLGISEEWDETGLMDTTRDRAALIARSLLTSGNTYLHGLYNYLKSKF